MDTNPYESPESKPDPKPPEPQPTSLSQLAATVGLILMCFAVVVGLPMTVLPVVFTISDGGNIWEAAAAGGISFAVSVALFFLGRWLYRLAPSLMRFPK